MILVIGGVNLDLLVESTRFEPCVSNPSKIVINLGGVGYNISKAIGNDAFFIYPVGKDVISNLIREKMDVRGIPLIIEKAAGGIFISIIENGKTLLSAVDNPAAEMVESSDILKILNFLKKIGMNYNYVVVDTNLSPNTLEKILKYLKDNGKKIFLDAVSPAKLERSITILKYVDTIHVNEYEFKKMCSLLELKDDLEYEKILNLLYEMHSFNTLILSLGENGVWLKHGDSVKFFNVKPITVERTTGAGDYLFGRFVYHLSKGFETSKAMEIALQECYNMLKKRSL